MTAVQLTVGGNFELYDIVTGGAAFSTAGAALRLTFTQVGGHASCAGFAAGLHGAASTGSLYFGRSQQARAMQWHTGRCPSSCTMQACEWPVKSMLNVTVQPTEHDCCEQGDPGAIAMTVRNCAAFPASVAVTRCNQASCVQATAAPVGPPDPTGFGSQQYAAQLPPLPPGTGAPPAATALCAAGTSAALLGRLNVTDCNITMGQPGLLCATLNLISSAGWTDACAGPSASDVVAFSANASATFVGLPLQTQAVAASLNGGQLSMCACHSLAGAQSCRERRGPTSLSYHMTLWR